MIPINHLYFTMMLIAGLVLSIVLREFYLISKNHILRDITITVMILTAAMLIAYPLLTIRYVQTL